MNKARRHELKMLKYKRRLKNYRISSKDAADPTESLVHAGAANDLDIIALRKNKKSPQLNAGIEI